MAEPVFTKTPEKERKDAVEREKFIALQLPEVRFRAVVVTS